MARDAKNVSTVSLLKGGDIFLLVLLLGTFIYSIFFFTNDNVEIASVTISHGAEVVYTLPLKDTVVSVAGDVGNVVVQIEAGEVSVIKAECPHQICRKTAPLSGAGGIICVPNRVSIDAHGKSGGVDATVR